MHKKHSSRVKVVEDQTLRNTMLITNSVCMCTSSFVRILSILFLSLCGLIKEKHRSYTAARFFYFLKGDHKFKVQESPICRVQTLVGFYTTYTHNSRW
ncbi:hypothetical protein QVD17_17576 [Tagetes erecta]|uniref:Uncharacterized protein n=1 Tax=Tagetes erecta TaxID=13708 RepID=A0AAD8KX47_TARER|nr:hypothetical protein QVD17_17576 [Tagetes erecta]